MKRSRIYACAMAFLLTASAMPVTANAYDYSGTSEITAEQSENMIKYYIYYKGISDEAHTPEDFAAMGARAVLDDIGVEFSRAESLWYDSVIICRLTPEETARARQSELVDKVMPYESYHIVFALPEEKLTDAAAYDEMTEVIVNELGIEKTSVQIYYPDHAIYTNNNNKGKPRFDCYLTAEQLATAKECALVADVQRDYPVMNAMAVSPVRGDANGDGVFTMSDIVAVERYILGCGSLRAPSNADLCSDGSVDVFDLTLMKQELLKEQSFPKFTVNAIKDRISGARKFYDPKEYDTIKWDSAQTAEYFGLDLEDLGRKISPQKAYTCTAADEYTMTVTKNGETVYDVVSFNYKNDRGGSVKIAASRIMTPYDYIFSGEKKESVICGIPVTIWGDCGTDGTYTDLCADLTLNGVNYRLTADGMKNKEFFDIITRFVS